LLSDVSMLPTGSFARRSASARTRTAARSPIASPTASFAPPTANVESAWAPTPRAAPPRNAVRVILPAPRASVATPRQRTPAGIRVGLPTPGLLGACSRARQGRRCSWSAQRSARPACWLTRRTVGHPAHAQQQEHGTRRSDGYARRRPEETVLYQTVAERWPAFSERMEESGGLPKFTARFASCSLGSGSDLARRRHQGHLRSGSSSCRLVRSADEPLRTTTGQPHSCALIQLSGVSGAAAAARQNRKPLKK